MAPKRGGGGSGGGSSSSSSSSSCGSYFTYPCTTELHFMYGSRSESYYTQAELYGQIVLFVIWSIAFVILFTQTLKPKARWLQAAIVSFFISFAFLCARYGVLIAEADVPIGYRFESSIVVMMQRLGIIFLFAGVFWPEAGKISRFAFWPVLGIYAILNITYLILDFLISSQAIQSFKYQNWEWRLSDRDVGLTFTPSALEELTMNGATTLSPYYVERRMYNIASDDDFQNKRSIQIKIGVAADFLALALAVFVGIVAGWSTIRKSRSISGAMWLLVAAGGLFLTSLFRVIIVTHYVLHNWNIVADFRRWVTWIDEFTFDAEGVFILSGAEGFLEGYRTTVQGFPIIQALFEPLGIVLACAAMVMWWRAKNKSERVTYGNVVVGEK